MKTFVKVDWTQCISLFQSSAFRSQSHTVRSTEEVPIGASYIVPTDYAATNGLSGAAYRPYEQTDASAPADTIVSCYDGTRYVPVNAQ